MSPERQENKALFNSDMNLWNNCDVVNLITNFRVGESNWNDTLNRIRYGEQNDKDYELLKSRYTTNYVGIQIISVNKITMKITINLFHTSTVFLSASVNFQRLFLSIYSLVNDRFLVILIPLQK